MSDTEQKATLTIALLAAFADGRKGEAERAQVQKIADSLSAGSSINVASLYQDVLFGKASVQSAALQLTTPEARQFAYEMAVAVCDADGARGAEEKTFLTQLANALGIEAGAAKATAEQGDAIASAPVSSVSDIEPPTVATTMTQAEMDKMILNYSILNGALELLPQSLASMAIIPLQMRMVYRVGKAHGYELDRGHIKDFLGTVGVGLTGQYVEQFGRKLIGGLLGKLAGGMGRSVGSMVTGSAFSFGTTYALGHVAKRYYAGGRTLSADSLKTAFSGVMGEAKDMQQRYLPQIQEKARTLDLGKVMQAVRQ